mmetsp:Transcript_3245/g.4422  ORF Transcript_3245/g.4422 Transcript_3245/m.4422 type:complete len:93 (+) Transcript_3245:372-650(+)
MMKDAMEYLSSSDLAIFFKFCHQFLHAFDFDPCLTWRRLLDAHNVQARRHIQTKIFQLNCLQRFFACLHYVRQSCIARLIQAKVAGNYGRKG